MRETKTDSEEFIAFIDSLKNEKWLGKSKQWWPKFLFHFTNINNAVNILETGALYSREYLEKYQLMISDNASVDVMSQTEEKWKNYVRLYFRPRTPTQYNNEGFRPKVQRSLNSNCPVPVYFLFDLKKVLTRKETMFSKGSLASSSVEAFYKADDFKNIPFHLVYHDQWFQAEERSAIVFHRHAEVIYPEKLDLDDLKYIWCRSEAEYHTMMHLLSAETKKRWKTKIGSGKKGNFFLRKWLFVEEVNMNKDEITFKMNPPQNYCPPFLVQVDIEESKTGRRYVWQDSEFHIDLEKPTLSIDLSNVKCPNHYFVSLYFEDQLVFSDEFLDMDLPF